MALAVLASAALAAPATGRQVPRDSAADTAPPVPVSPLSPRAAVERFLVLTREGEFVAAGAWLQLPESLQAEAPAMARRLKQVLDHYVWLDLEAISPAAEGNTADGLPRGLEQIGVIAPGGVRYPVRLARSAEGPPDTSEAGDRAPAWRFSRATTERIPGWFATLESAWLLDRLPAPLLRVGPGELLYWQWLALPVLLAIAALLGLLASRAIRWLGARAARRTRTTWDDRIMAQIGSPLTAAAALLVAAVLLPLLDLVQPAATLAFNLIRGALYFTLFWSLWRLVDIGREMALASGWASRTASSRALVPLGSRAVKVILFAIGIVAFVSFLGYPVASLIAGLGLGGLALALAAQKTVENLFGAFSLGLDQPFREGDFVKVEDFVGTVEAIGLRSTRFRTLDRTVISIPNGKLADSRLESLTERDRFRLALTVGLVYETTAAQMRQVLAGLERVLRVHASIWPDAVVVRFKEFADSSLNIEVMAWFRTSDWSEFQGVRQEILLAFMDVVETAGTSFAFPTRTLHVATLPPLERPAATPT